MNNFLVQFFLDTWDIIPFEMIFEWFMILFDKKVDIFLKANLKSGQKLTLLHS